jgi:hypothetical protein
MNFEIRILSQNWLGDEPENNYDLCTHGMIYFKIGDYIITDEEDEEWTISTTALGLLRSVIPDEETAEAYAKVYHCGMLTMASCPISIDWTVRHDGNVVIISELWKQPTIDLKDGICYLNDYQTVIVEKATYIREILKFSDSVAEFFDNSPVREIEDRNDKVIYKAFLDEFNSLRDRVRELSKQFT